MKASTYIILIGVLLGACREREGEKRMPVPPAKRDFAASDSSKRPENKRPAQTGAFDLADAERISGEAMYLSDSLSTREPDAWVFQSVYTAVADAENERKVYYMEEDYRDSQTCKKVYTAIYNDNSKNDGLEILTGIGDQAYYHSDGSNFCFVLARKGKKMVRLKVNKITDKTSKEAFLAVAKRMIDRLAKPD